MKETKRKTLVAASSFASLFALAAGLVFNHGSSIKEVKADGVVTNISTLTADHIAQDGETLTGKMKIGYRLQVADGATVTLDNVTWYDDSTWYGDKDPNLAFPGIELLGDGTLVLSGSNQIDWNHQKYSSIYVPVGKTLTIDAVDDTASLYCWHGDMAAAIGGGTDQDCGNIVINKGVISTSYGSKESSCIGGGPGGNCGTITINGGNITAKATWGAAIGSSVGKSVGTITINGGELNVEGVGAAIGPADGGTSSDIIVNGGIINAPAEEEFSRETAALSVTVGHTLYINGGEINVKGGSGSGGWFPTYGAAAIGASGLYACGDIVITGGTINAQGGARAAAIGSGEMFGCGNITIIDGIINATGGENGAGIGAAKGMACGSVVIEGGAVTAAGGINGAGIGGATGGNGVGLTVNGGTVIATGGENAAGIGGANGGNGGTLTVAGGTVTATGGANGAGVGGGKGGSGSSITFSGGELTATGGANAYGMGSGAGEGLAHGAITITDPTFAVHGGDSSDAMVQQNNYGSTRWQYMKIGLSSHTHNWSYTANGNTITAACSEDDCPTAEGLTLELEAPANLTYDGSAKAATLKAGYSADAFPGPEIKYYQGASEIAECVDAGSYAAKITFGGATASLDFVIAKATPTPAEVADRNATYGQSLSEIALPDGWAWNAPTDKVGDVGTRQHKATFTPADAANYNTVEQNVNIIVAKADPAYTVPTGLTALINKTLSTVSLPTGWAWDNPNENVGFDTGNKTFKATFTPADTANYNVIEHVDITVLVTEHEHDWSYTASGAAITASCGAPDCPTAEGLTLTLEAPKGDLHYDGTAKTATLKEGYSADAFPNPVIKYFSGNAEVSECVNVGSYIAKVTFGNAVAMVEFEILGKTMTDPDQPGVSVKIDDAIVEDNIELRVEVRTDAVEKETAADYEKIQKMLEANEQISKVYDVKLIRTVGGVETEIQPSDIKAGLKITVRMAIPEGVKMATTRILHIHSVDDMEFVTDYKVDGSDLVFEIGRLSQFAFVTNASASAGGLNGGIVALIVILSILAALAICFCLLFFVFAKYIIVDENGEKKVVKALKFGKEKKGEDELIKLFTFKFKKELRPEDEVFKKKNDAEDFIKSHQ